VRRFLLAAVALFSMAAATAACDDSLELGEPLLGRDSMLVLAAPGRSATIASAIDIARLSTARPELPRDAAAWDYALREVPGGLRLVPNPFVSSRLLPLITRDERDYEDIERAPTARSAYGDTAITLTQGAVYLIRSRQYPSSSGGLCYNFAKIQVDSVNVAAGTIRMDITGNLRCADDRLVYDD
jgi:hypothetical protein